MNREEAIKELTDLLPEEFLSEYTDAIKMSIEALEQEQCGDCVSREAVENAIKHAEVNFTVNSDIDFTKHKREVQEIVNGIIDAQIKALRDLPSVTPQPQKWIPVSERLPEDSELVLFSTKTDRVFEGRYFDDDTKRQWYSFRDETFAWDNVVTAWMPLPEPYKTESEVK